MTKLALVIVIALGYVLGMVIWELIGLAAEWIGKLVGWMIAQSMKRMIAVRQEQAIRAAEAVARQRPPIVRETGRSIEDHENLNTTS